MSSVVPPHVLRRLYAEAAEEYLRGLPLEHFMEATPQATQRKITVASLEVIQVDRPDVQTFNEWLVQSPQEQSAKPGQVVPDNMVVVSKQPIGPRKSYNLPLESAPPFWVMEYVSEHNKRKDYEESFVKYERDLKV